VAIKVTGQPPNVLAIKVQRSTGAKLKGMTGFEPQISLPEGLMRTAQAYRAYYRKQALMHPRKNGRPLSLEAFGGRGLEEAALEFEASQAH
jgi:hypothetical protein